MVFENIAAKIKKDPLHFFLLVFLTTSFSLLISYYVLPEESSILFVFFIVVSFVSTFRKMILLEEEVLEYDARKSFTKKLKDTFVRNSFIISAYFQLFFGVAVTITFWFLILPENVVVDLFSKQIETIRYVSGHMVVREDVISIFINNFKVLLVAFLLSFVFGTGALFITSWNASVVGVFIGNMGREVLQKGGIAVLSSVTMGYSSILLHGIPEVLAYFIGGISGGILSIGIFRKKYTKEIIEDSLFFLFLSIFLLLIAALIEGGY